MIMYHSNYFAGVYFCVGMRVTFTDPDSGETFQGVIIDVTDDLLGIAFDDGEEGYESPADCVAAPLTYQSGWSAGNWATPKTQSERGAKLMASRLGSSDCKLYCATLSDMGERVIISTKAPGSERWIDAR